MNEGFYTEGGTLTVFQICMFILVRVLNITLKIANPAFFVVFMQLALVS